MVLMFPAPRRADLAIPSILVMADSLSSPSPPSPSPASPPLMARKDPLSRHASQRSCHGPASLLLSTGRLPTTISSLLALVMATLNLFLLVSRALAELPTHEISTTSDSWPWKSSTVPQRIWASPAALSSDLIRCTCALLREMTETISVVAILFMHRSTQMSLTASASAALTQLLPFAHTDDRECRPGTPTVRTEAPTPSPCGASKTSRAPRSGGATCEAGATASRSSP
mmetsp:Transcript_737/g.2914  ORF Transcript_737/g.2914 Transcript_737/m.2914 type:complete len:229 (-) Transcript_737:1796-2482(-)